MIRPVKQHGPVNPNFFASALTFSHFFMRSIAMSLTARRYLFTRFLVPTHSLFPCWLLKSRVSHFRVQSTGCLKLCYSSVEGQLRITE